MLLDLLVVGYPLLAADVGEHINRVFDRRHDVLEVFDEIFVDFLGRRHVHLVLDRRFAN